MMETYGREVFVTNRFEISTPFGCALKNDLDDFRDNFCTFRIDRMSNLLSI